MNYTYLVLAISAALLVAINFGIIFDRNNSNGNCDKTSFLTVWIILIISTMELVHNIINVDKYQIAFFGSTISFSIILLLQPLYLQRKRKKSLGDKYISSKKF